MYYKNKITILLIMIIFSFTVAAQQTIQSQRYFVFISDDKYKITDLSQRAKEKCVRTITKRIGNGIIEFNVQSKFIGETKDLLNNLEKSYEKTQELLAPLKIEKIKFYLLQSDDVPVNYKIGVDSTNEKVFPYIFVFKDKKELAMNCSPDDNLCKEVFQTIPHELTHGALGDVINRNARWFDEGLAEYISTETGNSFVPQINNKRIESYVPAVSLYRGEIRQNIWFWREADAGTLKRNKEKELQNDYFYYGAAHQMIRLIVEKAKSQNTEKPLEVLFNQLINLQKEKQRLIGSEEILTLIQENLRVNPKELGNINEPNQEILVQEALKMLSQNNLDVAKKYYALYVLAGIDKIPISDKWLDYLLNEVYAGDYNTIIPNLAATALARRVKQSGFDNAVEDYLSYKNKELSVRKVKKDLQKFSIRPPEK